MANFFRKAENYFGKILIGFLVVVVSFGIFGYLFHENYSCQGAVWDCLEMEILFFIGGLLAFFIPIGLISIVWKIWQFFYGKNNDKN
jgi:hypothetical protein